MQTKLNLLKIFYPIKPKFSLFLGQSIKPTAYYTSNKPSNDNNDNIKIDPPKTFFQKYFGLKSCIASPKFKNRWLMVIPCFMSNLSIGFPYAWSIVAGLKFPYLK